MGFSRNVFLLHVFYKILHPFSLHTQDTPRTHSQPHAQPTSSYMNIDEFFTQCNACDNDIIEAGERIRVRDGRRKPAKKNIQDSTSLALNSHLVARRRSNAPTSETIANYPPNPGASPPHRTHKHRAILNQGKAAVMYDSCPPLTTILTEKEKIQILSQTNKSLRRVRSDEDYEASTRYPKSGHGDPSTTTHISNTGAANQPLKIINNQEFDDPNLRNSIPFNSPGERQSLLANASSHTTRRSSASRECRRSPPPSSLPKTSQRSVVVIEPAEHHAMQVTRRQRRGSADQQSASIITSSEAVTDQNSDYYNKNNREEMINLRISEKLNTIKSPPLPPPLVATTIKQTSGYSIDNRHHRHLDISAGNSGSISSRNFKGENIDLIFTEGRNKRSLTPEELEQQQQRRLDSYSTKYEEDEDIEVDDGGGYGTDTSEVYNIEGVRRASEEESNGYETKESTAKSIASLKGQDVNTTDNVESGDANASEGGESADPQKQQQQQPTVKKRGGGKPGRRRKRGYIYDPKPLVPKSKTSTLPEELKDEDYWTRRQRNNEAAKRSRENRRVKELEMMSLVKNLTNTNTELRNRIKELESRNSLLEQVLKRNPIIDNSGGSYASSD